jgi:head-tail adaptor
MYPELRPFAVCRPVKATIEQLAATQDALGAPSTTWQAFASGLETRIRSTGGMERAVDQAIAGVSLFDALVKYVKGVNERMRLSFTNDGTQFYLDVVNVDNVRLANRWLILHCKAGVSRG